VKYYVYHTVLVKDDAGTTRCTPVILTKPDTLSVAQEGQRRFKKLGIHAQVGKQDADYQKLLRAQRKRRKASRELTKAEVAEIVGEA